MRRRISVSVQRHQGLLQLPEAPSPGELRQDHGKDAAGAGDGEKALIF